MKTLYLFTLLLFLLPFNLFAQAINDECGGIIDLGTAPFCNEAFYSNVDATQSDYGNLPDCFNSTPDRDVWFSFVASDTIIDYVITLTGITDGNGSTPMLNPEIAIYRGDCELDGLAENDCGSAAAGANMIQIDVNGLTPGATYFIRVNDYSENLNPNSGTFQLCVEGVVPSMNINEIDMSSACNGTLFDSGGPDGEYTNNETHTFVLCPDNPSACINFDIISDIEPNFDFLNFYDGMDTNGMLLWSFSGIGGNTTLQFGGDCVTIEFTSDVTVTEPGFEINWSCSPVACETDLIPCLETTAVNGLPFNSTGLTTCGTGNDVSDGPCADAMSNLEGEDVIYTYTPFSDGCIDIVLTGVDLNTGLSIFDACPETATNCIAIEQNLMGDSVVIRNLEVTAFQQVFIVVSNENCTSYDIEILEVECPPFIYGAPFCEDAYLLNSCAALPEVFLTSTVSTSYSPYFQSGVNDGCWSGTGAEHYTWLIFQAQATGDFGFLAQNEVAAEASNIDIQVWGPIMPDDLLCNYVTINQPLRSTAAQTLGSTGLVDTNPNNGMNITDECESGTGDGYVSTIPVTQNMVYAILINDFDGNILSGNINLDFSPTSPGVLDGLPMESFYTVPEYDLIGNAFYNPDLGDESCIQMTAAQNTQLSCVWLSDQVDFSKPFTNTVTMNFGNIDGNGADGLALVYQQSAAGLMACGQPGRGLGAEGIDNSFIVEFDTWQNNEDDFMDPFQDHIAVNVNGDMANPIAGPVTQGNIEDGMDHIVTLTWEPVTMTYQVFFDGVLQITGVYDIINNSLNGDPLAFCGFTGSTGGAVNLQYVCTGDNVFPTNSLDTISMSICEGDSLFVGGANQTTAGFYTDVFTAIDGCDSLVVTDLSIIAISTSTVSVSLCEGESLFVGGANQTMNGSYIDTLFNANANACDSIITTNLTFTPVSTSSVSISLCEGESLFVGGANQTMDGIYIDTLLNADVNGCDSIISTNLTFFPTSTATISIDLCEGESLFVGGANQTMDGIYIDTLFNANVNGCDSIITTNLSFLPVSAMPLAVNLCEGESLFVGGAEQTTTGIYIDTLAGANVNGCDSIVATALTFISTEVSIAEPDNTNCQIPCVMLNAETAIPAENLTIEWMATNGGSIEDGQTSLTPTVCGAGDYSITITQMINDLTCTGSNMVSVEELNNVTCDYEIPNIFTPDGDGLNDIFRLVDEGNFNEVINLRIFNRWGEIIHEGSGTSHPWDGMMDNKPAPSDVYVYIFQIRNSVGEEVVESGDLTLLR